MDPNMSLMLGVKDNDEDTLLLPSLGGGGGGISLLDMTMSTLRESTTIDQQEKSAADILEAIRKEVNSVQNMIASHYAEQMGNECITQ